MRESSSISSLHSHKKREALERTIAQPNRIIAKYLTERTHYFAATALLWGFGTRAV